MSSRGELVAWSQERRCERVVGSLQANGFVATFCPTAQQAREYIVSEAATACTIGFGGSLSVSDLGIVEALGGCGKELLIHGAPGLAPEIRIDIMRRQLTCDLFLTGTNAVTLSGKLVNIDATGNRAASMFFGPKKVIVVAGRNKIVDGSVEDAVRRVRELASPPNAKRLGYKTPCAVTGFCADCNSPERICRIITVLEKRPRLTDLQVLVVNEDLGL